MKLHKNQTGFTIVEVSILIVVIAVLAIAGYTFYNRQQNSKTSESTTRTQQAEEVPSAPEVNSTSDLDKANSTLDKVNPDEQSDSSQLDSELNNF